jgi:hypothetical protein
MKKLFTVTCKGCNYWDSFESEAIAEAAAVFHVMETSHAVKCCRPAHFHEGAVPVLVFDLTVEQAAAIVAGRLPK